MCDIGWLIKIRFGLRLLIDPNTPERRDVMRNICKRAFHNTILQFIWSDIFCFDLLDDNMEINVSNDRRRQLLGENEYDTQTSFQYNKELQNAFFDNDEMFALTQ